MGAIRVLADNVTINTNIIVVFLRWYIVLGFIVAILGIIYVIRKLDKLEQEIRTNREILCEKTNGQNRKPHTHQKIR